MPESPRYLICKGEEEKAKKVLTFVAKLNCTQLIPGRLVTQEVKEAILKERSCLKASNTLVESSFYEDKQSVDGKGEEAPSSSSEDEDLDDDQPIIMKSGRSPRSQISDRDKCSWFYLRKMITTKLVNYYHWILILFKNGWWRTTLLLWYLW